MIQKNYAVRGFDELKEKLPEIQGAFCACNYQDGVINVYIASIPEDEVKKILDLLKESFPKLKIIGMSGISLEMFHDTSAEPQVRIDFVLMESAGVTLFSKEFSRDSDNLVDAAVEYAKDLNRQIRDMKNVKCIEIYFAWIKASASIILTELSKGLEKVPIFGAVANENDVKRGANYFHSDNRDSIVVSDNWFGPGVSVAVYSGEDLYVYADCLFGWKPMGKYLDVHATEVSREGQTAILTIDGAKATDIYKKYLGVEPDEYFVTNISEFPLVVERDGMYMGRTPSGYGENGEILLEADIHSGEKVTLSYAEHEEILIGTLDAASRMSAFGAERLSLVICGSRFTFLQDEYHLEMDYFNKGRETDGTLVLGLGEIYRYQGQGGILNSALVAVGMKEGLSDDISRTIVDNTPEEKEPELIPLSVRLSHFLRTMTEELEEAVNEAESANQAKSLFLSNMSHEIRTPINAVLGMDEMILRETEEPQTMEYAQNIKAAGNTLLSLVNEILDFSKIEAGKLDIIPVDYDLSSVVNDLMNMIKPRAEAKELTLDFDIDPLLPSVLCGDEIRIKQVITNILTNAVKYTNEGSVKLSMTYEKIAEDTANLKVSVKDTGIGIKREDMKNLFSPFQRVDEVKNRAVEGTGLGLDITVRLLELMGSRLEVSSNYGKGSEFSFNLKQKVVSWEPLGDYIEAYSRALSQKEKYKERFTAADAQILVVDDTPMNLAVFEGLLRKTMVNIDKAESGLECLNMTRQKKYDLIFLDYRMPNMDGVETLQHLKDDKENPNAGTVVICLTANAVSGAREQYIEAGFDDYLTKPIMADKLEGMMIRYLPEDKVKIKADDGQDDAVDLEKELKALPEWLKESKILDINAGVENCGDASGFLMAIETFMEAAPDYLSDIEGFLKEEKIPDYTIKVHAVKSSARIIGAGELSLLAEKLEKAGDDKDLEFISQNTPQLLSMLGGLYESLSANMGKCSQEQDLPLIEEERLKEALDSIRELVPSFDYDGINYIVNALGEYSIPEEHRGLLENLKGALRRADWDEIKELLG